MASGVEIIRGHVLETLPTLAEASVQTVVTSPPYWGLRDYGTDPVAWPTVRFPMMPGVPYEAVVPAMDASLGLEQTHVAYIGHLVAVFRAVERVLRTDGTLWLNLGDAYGAKKQLRPLPWLVAFALQADGWILRSWIPWVKRNPMPTSQRDRPTASCEIVFLLAHPKSKGRYTYDHEAVLQPFADARMGCDGATAKSERNRGGRTDGFTKPNNVNPSKNGGRTWRTADAFFGSLQAILDGGQGMLSNDEGDPLALVVNTKPYKKAHFATFPPHLVEPCIQAGAPEHGCCPTCGKAWVRVIERTTEEDDSAKGSRFDTGKTGNRDGGDRTQKGPRCVTRAAGWKPCCTCPAADPIPCTVLDPFGGAGSTGLAASKLGRHAVLCELSDDYADQAEARVAP